MSRREYFNGLATNWDGLYMSPDLHDFLRTFVPRFGLKPGQRILDLGTGTGVLIPHLFTAVGPSGAIIAVDFAENMAATFKSKYSRLEKTAILLGDAEQLGFREKSFDAVTCLGLIPHLQNREKALREINRVLTPYGKLVIAHALSSAEIRMHHREAGTAVAGDDLPKETEMRKLLSNAGFAVNLFEDRPGCYLCLATRLHNDETL
ncbi:MAG TPA: methyltransferase domain-containing protein [Candidatus Bathyarchaeia archaeon]|nr:methyltransferase domain-containing protein [Candidatus Bathyarchaeia archaeon]